MAERWDWDAARARRAAAEAAIADTALSEAERDAIFARRAELLAAPIELDPASTGTPSLVFSLGTERYAVPGWQVREVRAASQVTPLPGTPPFVAGLMNVRGRVISVLDLRPLFGIPSAGAPPQTAMLLSSPRGDVAVLADDRPTLRWLVEDELGPLPPGGPAGLDPAFVRGVTRDLVAVLDAERLLSDPRIVVQDDGRSGAESG